MGVQPAIRTRPASLYYVARDHIFRSTDLSHYRPLGLQEFEAPEFLDNRHLKVVWLSVIRTGRFYPPGKIPGTHFC
jgi:hypothetical protein